ncbi:MAG: type VI secretion system protein TssA [Acidobacteriota bacterium]
MSSAIATAKEESLDMEALLTPIPGNNPVGESLQYSGLYSEIREARRVEEAFGESQAQTKTPAWSQIANLAIDALQNRTKDLQIGVWLVEALVKLHGFAGLRAGLEFIRELMVRYWDNLYPEIEEGDLEGRANALAWLDRQLAVAIKEVPITNSATGTNYSYFQWQESKEFEIPENLEGLDSDALKPFLEMRERAEKEGKITSEKWRIAERTSKRAFYEETAILLDQSWQEFEALDRLMDEKLARETPGMGALKMTLDELRTLIGKIVKEKRILEPDPQEEATTAMAVAEQGPAAIATSSKGGMLNTGGTISNRLEAIKRLKEIAEYFHKAEPHNPISYLIDRAVKWGEMPLDRWLVDVIKNDDVLKQLRDTLGIIPLASAPAEE